MHSRLLAVLCAATTLTLTAPALAKQVYAAPAASGTADCTSAADACVLANAIAAANVNGDELLLAGGTYPAVTTQLTANHTITIRAADPAARPLLQFTSGGQLRTFSATLRDVDVSAFANGGTAPLYNNGGVIEGVRVTSTGGGTTGINSYTTTIRNSTIVVNGSTARGIDTAPNGASATENLRNVTVLATGTGSRALYVGGGATGTTTVNLTNVIARGSGAADIQTYSGGATVTTNVSHSSYGTTAITGSAVIVDQGGNQTGAAPVFVDQAGGDLREAAGSPTIDAGADDPLNGTLDVVGGLRQIATTDIGAYEFVPAPVVGTGSADPVSPTSATISAPVTPGGLATTIHVEFGPTAAYGSNTAGQDAGSGAGATPQTVTLEGLTANTSYHARLVAVSSGGTTATSDLTFTTPDVPVAPAADPPAADPPVQDPPAPPVGGEPAPDGAPAPGAGTPPPAMVPATLVGRSIRAHRGRLTLTLRCSATASAGCRGSVRLAALRLVFRRGYTLAPDTTAHVTFRPSAALLRAIRATGRRGLRATARTAAGQRSAHLRLRS
jgi:hypothetical protein